jgi:hypothetical protein
MNGSYRFKRSGSANASEKRFGADRTDANGNMGFGASKTPTREGYINLARPGSPPIWRKKGPNGGIGTRPRKIGGMKIIGPGPGYGFRNRGRKGK